jgi:PKD repeat protein
MSFARLRFALLAPLLAFAAPALAQTLLSRLLASLVLLVVLAPLASAQPSFGTGDEFRAIATFHSLGLYWSPQGKGTSAIAEVRYKPAGAPQSAYKRGLDLWYDLRNGGEYRGSLVHLQPGTAYDIRLTLSSGLVRDFAATAGSTTWSETFSGTETDVNTLMPASGYRRLWLRGTQGHSGSPGNWKIYTAPAGSNTIDQNGFGTNADGDGNANNDNCVNLEGVSYVVIRGLNLRNCTNDAIRLFGGSHHVVIEDNDITGWGRLDGNGNPMGNGGVFCNDSTTANKVSQLVVQRNAFHSPRHGSAPWGPQNVHPVGPLAVRLDNCGSNHVLRYNDLFATEDHYFMDGFGGAENFGNDEPRSGIVKGGGFPWADSDIYGNRIQNVFDDAIEAEGDNRNVRIWENYIDRAFVVMGNAATARGPLYVWRNVSHSTGGMNQRPISGANPALPDDEHRGPFVKGGGQTTTYRGGRAYYFHNTILQPPPSACGGINLPCGAGWGFENVEDLYNIHSHNNLWQIHKPQQINGQWKFFAVSADCDLGSAANQTACLLSHDMFNGGAISGATLTSPPDWRNAPPAYGSSGAAYPSSASIPAAANQWSGDFALQAGSTGHGAARALFNFNDQHASPDVGAHQSGTPRMKFGRAAATGGGPVTTPPTAALGTTPSPASGPGPLTVTFNAAGSIDGSSPITSLRLQFGHDNQEITWNSKGQTQQYTYPAGAAQYTATLTVTSAHGQDDAQVQVTVTNSCSAPPSASFTATPGSGPAPLTVAFDASASSAVSPATIASYSINYGDSTGSGTGVTQSHQYAAQGEFTATLTVTDTNGCQDTEQQTIAVGPPQGGGQATVTLQEGLNSYSGSTDTWMWSGAADATYGAEHDWQMRLNTTTATLLRFPIFQADGGPVPDGATILSATLSVYKFNGATAGTYNARRLLRPWLESQATWNSAASGSAWAGAGAQGAADVTADGEAQASMGTELGWLSYDVLAIVQAWSGGAANHGFRMRQVAGENQPHDFIAKDHPTQATLRPKLTISYTTTPPPGNTATLQEGLNSYTGSADTWMWSGEPDTNYGGQTDWEMRLNTTTATLLRFPIFQAEGGPVPDGATITSATLSVYKFNGASAGTYNARRLLRPWIESQATWDSASSGTAWALGGAQGGTDVTTAGEAQASMGTELGWLSYDVTSMVQAWRGGAPNYGFRMRQIAGENQPHDFTAKDHPQAMFRPKLTVNYQ